MNSTIHIANDYTKYPGLRYERLSEGASGEKFRDEFLIPALKEHESITIVLDGNIGEYLPSFLEECFGGLVRINNYSVSQFNKKVNLIASLDPNLIEDIRHYVDKASK